MDLTPILPALLDALSTAGIGVVAFAATDKGMEKLYLNEALTKSLGYSVEEWREKPPWELIVPSQQQQVGQLFNRVVSGEQSAPALFEVALMHRDGEEFRAECTIGRVQLGAATIVVAVVRDMSVHRQTQLSLLEADRLAIVGALASGFAHETNNPLTSVLLNLRTLRKQVMTNLGSTAQTSALRCLDDITTGAERIAGNVRALQTLATRSTTHTLDLATVVSSALRLAAPTLEPRANVVRQIFPVVAVAGEEARIGQAVLAMLLFSASGFDGEKAVSNNRIIVAVEEREGNVVVEVSDNGKDLTAPEAEHAFDPFFRSNVRGAGVGVGLGIARSIAITLGGDVSLAPRTGGGAVITMRLPRAPQQQA